MPRACLLLVLAQIACADRAVGGENSDPGFDEDPIPAACETLVQFPIAAEVRATAVGDDIHLGFAHESEPPPGCHAACPPGWWLGVTVPAEVLEQAIDLTTLDATAQTMRADDSTGDCTCRATDGTPTGGLTLYYVDADTICGHLEPTSIVTASGDFWAAIEG